VIGHQLAKDIIWRYAEHGMPHSLILVGPAGVGKRMLADLLVATKFCDNRNICGECAGCRTFNSEVKAGYYLYRRDRIITIDEIRELKRDLQQSEWAGRPRFVVFEAAANITEPATNAILKILEEPGANVHFIFLTENLRRVLPTIVSRSAIVYIGTLTRPEIRQVMSDKDLSEEHLEILSMGKPARLEQMSAVSLKQHLQNVRNFWTLVNSSANAQLAFTNKMAKIEETKLKGLLFFWESCLRDYWMWKNDLQVYRWWSAPEIDEIYGRQKNFDIQSKILDLASFRKYLDKMSVKIQIFNWLNNFH